MKRTLLSIAFSLGLAAPLLAGAPVSAQPPTELWRRDTSFLQADRMRAQACMTAADSDAKLDACKSVVADACPKPNDEDAAAPPLSARLCAWRGIAAWEDEMAATVQKLNAALDRGGRAELVAAQRAWKTSMLADVLLNSDLYKGGTLAGVLAAQTRADATAARTIFLEKTFREIQR